MRKKLTGVTENMTWFHKRFSLAAKFGLCAILLVLATSIGICLFTIQFETKEHYDELLNRGINIAAITAKNCETGISESNKAVLFTILESLSADPDIAYVSVMNRQYSVLASRNFKGQGELSTYSIPNTGVSTRARHSDFLDERDGKQYIEILFPIIRAENDDKTIKRNGSGVNNRDKTVIGYLRLGLAQEDFLNAMRKLVISITMFTFFVLLAGMGFAILFSRGIISPLKRLTKAAQDIAEGTFDTPIQVHSNDEIYDLAKSFNNMQDRLRSYRKQVEERTNELSSSNMRLTDEINAREAVETQLQHDGLHDALTGLPNRTLFIDRLSHVIMLAKRRKDYLYAVLFVDIDRFKILNDSLGHGIGDKVLVMFGQQIKISLRPHDTIARFGGDAFAILLEDISAPANAMYIAERVGAEFMEPFMVDDHEIFVSASVGIAFGNNETNERPDHIVRNAEIAMYKAKDNSKTKYIVFEAGMHAHAVERMQLETALRKSVERRELLVYYQPIVATHTGDIVGFEALVRWPHPERGIINPGEFVPIAEESGLIVSIDRFVLGEACKQMQTWLGRLPGSSVQYISVNLSNRQMEQPDLVNYVKQVLDKTGLDPEHLKLEITENVIIKDPETVATVLDQLRSLGVQLYIDDFGTGYSSLSYLHRLPINGFKIDRSFIKRLGTQGENQEIIRTIMLLARDLKVDVVAEGIETENQLEQIKSLNCEYWQGYLSSTPVSADLAEKLLTSRLFPGTITEKNIAYTSSTTHPG
jgi:diguanylate cyclase (GGDEF)-like protein